MMLMEVVDQIQSDRLPTNVWVFLSIAISAVMNLLQTILLELLRRNGRNKNPPLDQEKFEKMMKQYVSKKSRLQSSPEITVEKPPASPEDKNKN